MNDPSLRLKLLDRLQELLQTEFTENKLFPVLDTLEADIARDAALDRQRWPPMGPGYDLHRGIAQVKGFIQSRRAYLLSELPRLRASQ
jgi:hypothetical protein